MEKKEEVKEKVKSKFKSAVEKDLTEAKIDKEIYNVKMTDGKVSAEFSVSGLPVKKEKNNSLVTESNYRRWQKIFDDCDSFSDYAKEFFAEDFNKYE